MVGYIFFYWSQQVFPHAKTNQITHTAHSKRGACRHACKCVFLWAPYFHIFNIRLVFVVPLQNLSGEDAAHLVHGGQDPACSGQVSGRAETKSHSSSPLERYDCITKIQLSGAEKYNQGWVIVKHGQYLLFFTHGFICGDIQCRFSFNSSILYEVRHLRKFEFCTYVFIHCTMLHWNRVNFM